MNNQNAPQNNARPPANVCVDPPWIGFPNTNWGTSIGPAFSVRLDPQINVRLDLPSSVAKEPDRLSVAAMEELTREFAEWNDDLLGELAR